MGDRARWIQVPLLCVLALACAPVAVQLYDGPERPASEIARITFYEPAQVHRVDATRVHRLDTAFEVLPGRHTFEFQSRRDVREFGATSIPIGRGTAEQTYTLECRLLIDLEAGRHYEVRSQMVRADPGSPTRDLSFGSVNMGLALMVNDAATGDPVPGLLQCL